MQIMANQCLGKDSCNWLPILLPTCVQGAHQGYAAARAWIPTLPTLRYAQHCKYQRQSNAPYQHEHTLLDQSESSYNSWTMNADARGHGVNPGELLL